MRRSCQSSSRPPRSSAERRPTPRGREPLTHQVLVEHARDSARSFSGASGPRSCFWSASRNERPFVRVAEDASASASAATSRRDAHLLQLALNAQAATALDRSAPSRTNAQRDAASSRAPVLEQVLDRRARFRPAGWSRSASRARHSATDSSRRASRCSASSMRERRSVTEPEDFRSRSDCRRLLAISSRAMLGGGADALDLQLELVDVGRPAQRLFERDEPLLIQS